MNLNIISSESAKARSEKAYALFYVKQSVQFSKVLSDTASAQIESVLKGIKDGPFEDLEFLEIDVRRAYEALGFITGDSVQDDIIKEIFSRFCLGK